MVSKQVVDIAGFIQSAKLVYMTDFMWSEFIGVYRVSYLESASIGGSMMRTINWMID